MLKQPLKRYIFVIAILVSYYTQSQNIIKLEYQYYTSWFSKNEHIPLVVEYTLTKTMLECDTPVPRAKKFSPDPEHWDITNLNNDYKNSGFDRGHNMNANDNRCNETGMKQCFYFSNMTPQPHSFNAGKWEELERKERKEAIEFNEIIVTCGSIGEALVIGPDKVVVPKYMWKVIYIPSENKYQCFLFPNTTDVTNDLSSYEVSLSQIEKNASVTFVKGIVSLGEEN